VTFRFHRPAGHQINAVLQVVGIEELQHLIAKNEMATRSASLYLTLVETKPRKVTPGNRKEIAHRSDGTSESEGQTC